MKILIIGSSAAGISAAAEIRKKNREVKVTVVSDEKHYFYHRPSLTEYLSDSNVELKTNFYPNRPEWYAEQEIELLLDTRIIGVEPATKEVVCANGSRLAYDKLIIAAGAEAFVPGDEYHRFANVHTLRTLDDARRIYNCSEKCRKIIIVGSGVLGLEAAYALSKRGLEIDILERGDRVLPLQLDLEGSELLSEIIRSAGVRLHTGVKIAALQGGEEVERVVAEDGRELATDMVILAIGARANLSLTAGSGIETDRGILVNERMETNLPDILACGDVVQFGNSPQLWMPALKQGKVAGLNALGESEVFKHEDYPVILNSFGIRLFSAGDIGNGSNPADYITLQKIDREKRVYQKLYFKNHQLCGTIQIGDVRKMLELTKAVNRGLSLEESARLI